MIILALSLLLQLPTPTPLPKHAPCIDFSDCAVGEMCIYKDDGDIIGICYEPGELGAAI
jgi:hypothetical protein